MKRVITMFVLAALMVLPAFSQSSNPADWPREIVQGWNDLVDYQADRMNVVGLINFEQACVNWQLNYSASAAPDAHEAAYPIPVAPNQAVRGEVPVSPAHGTYMIPFVVFTAEPIAPPCVKPKRDIAPEGVYGFGPPVDPDNPGGSLLIKWPTTIPAGSIRDNPANGRKYKLVFRTYGSFTAKWWEPVG